MVRQDARPQEPDYWCLGDSQGSHWRRHQKYKQKGEWCSKRSERGEVHGWLMLKCSTRTSWCKETGSRGEGSGGIGSGGASQAGTSQAWAAKLVGKGQTNPKLIQILKIERDDQGKLFLPRRLRLKWTNYFRPIPATENSFKLVNKEDLKLTQD